MNVLTAARAAAVEHVDYLVRQRGLRHLPADLGHLVRRRRTDALLQLVDIAGHASVTLHNLSVDLWDAYVRSGRDWEAQLGIDRSPDATFTRGAPGSPHTSDEPCTCDPHDHGCGPDGPDDDDPYEYENY